ncbi:MAG: hypothetical protein WCL49_01980 [bacterium]
MGLSLACTLWCLPAFLILTRVPRPPRTALSGRDHFIQGMTPVAVSVITLALASALIGFLLIHPAPSMHPSLPSWFMETGIWVILAIIGIGLLPYGFPSSGFIREIPLDAATRLMAGLAWASCWTTAWESAQSGNPTLFLLGAIFGVLPDTLDHWIARQLHRTHIHIVPDPLAPDTHLIAESLSLALARCRDRHSMIRLQLYPGQTQTGQWRRYTLRFDNLERLLVVTHDHVTTIVPLPCAITTDQSFTLATEHKPLCLELDWIPDGRINLRADPNQQQWSHSLVTATGFGVVAGMVWGVPAGCIAGGAYALHCIVDQLGFNGSALLFPFTRKNKTGIQFLIPSRESRFQACMIWLALLLTCWNGARIIVPDSATPSPISVLLLGGALPCAILAGFFKKQHRPPNPC